MRVCPSGRVRDRRRLAQSPRSFTTLWTQSIGPSSPTFANASTLDSAASFSDSGTYVLQLTADNSVLSASDLVTITVLPGCAAETIRVRVASGSDDAKERADGGISLASSDLELIYDGSDQTVGLRFNSIDIPQGAAILSAAVQFQVDEVSTGVTSLIIEGQATDDASAFTSTNSDISSRSRSGASVIWEPASWSTLGAAGPDQRTPNIALVIQEIVNRSGWTRGNSLVIIITGIGERVAESYNGVSGAAPLLEIDYDEL